jgi:hypothetical protein
MTRKKQQEMTRKKQQGMTRKKQQEMTSKKHKKITCIWYPPLPRILIIKLHLLHHTNIIPISKDNQTQIMLQHINFQFLDLVGKELLFRVDQQKSTIITSIETGVWFSKDLYVIPGAPKVGVHVLEVGVNVVTSPVQGVRFDV